MKVVLQRVNEASVEVEGKTVGRIGKGLLALVGAGKDDSEVDVEAMADKLLSLRIFEDSSGKMNLSCLDLGYSVLAVSQFTLLADCRRGRRPSFTNALEPEAAERLYDLFVQRCKDAGVTTETGIFGAKMSLKLENWGPVTIILDTAEWRTSN
jgi:D-tyrosyl-tRNA(Tyr) deacylase